MEGRGCEEKGPFFVFSSSQKLLPLLDFVELLRRFFLGNKSKNTKYQGHLSIIYVLLLFALVSSEIDFPVLGRGVAPLIHRFVASSSVSDEAEAFKNKNYFSGTEG